MTCTISDWLLANSRRYVSRQKMFRECCEELGVSARSVRRAYSRTFSPEYTEVSLELIEDGREIPDPVTEMDHELVSENVRLGKKNQKLQDTNRVERKAFREQARIENTLETMGAELLKIMREHAPDSIPARVQRRAGDAVGVIHVSDPHFNELVTLKSNRYDFETASRRFRKLLLEAVSVFSAEDVKMVWVLFGGDMLNSDRRLDEKMSMATNRMSASFLAYNILQQFITELHAEGFPVNIVSVSGNESRINDEHGHSIHLLHDNYDFLIHNLLQIHFENIEGVDVLSGDPAEQVLVINGNTVLLAHGESIKGADIEKGMQKIFARYSANYGMSLDYVLTGHRHCPSISDYWAVNGSVVGSNAYSEHGLQVTGRASQNIFVVRPGDIRGTRVDLQDVEDVEGYTYSKALEAYNPKSAKKLATPTVLHSTVII